MAQVGDRFDVGAYTLHFEDVQELKGPNYFATRGVLSLEKSGNWVARMTPEKRVYPVAQMPTTEAAIDTNFLRDVYVVLGDPQDSGGWAIRTYIKPLTIWIWIGCALMALGGLLSLTDRRFRVAAGTRRSQQRVAAE